MTRNKEYWLKALTEGQENTNQRGNYEYSRLEYLGDYIFDFTTYDSKISEKFAQYALEVCDAIQSGKTHEYIKRDEVHYERYILMCNMPFFSERLDWGTSIRGAFWSYVSEDYNPYKLKTSGLWYNDEQLTDQIMTRDEWVQFIYAVMEFGK